MEMLRSYLINHRRKFDKIMLAWFMLGLILIVFALCKMSAFTQDVEAETVEGKQPLRMVSKGSPVHPTEQILVSMEATDAEENVHQRSTEVTKHPLDDIDFSSNGQAITLKIMPEKVQFNEDASISISFLPGDHCEFGDGHACIYEYISSAGKQIIMVSVHSGGGAEAEALRNFLEGTGFFQGAHTPEQVRSKMQSLVGSAISIEQGEKVLDALSLIAFIRVPPAHFDAYMALPVEQTLDYALELMQLDPSVLDQDLLVFETCGWKLPGEEAVAGLNYTSNTIYLGLVQLINHE